MEKDIIIVGKTIEAAVEKGAASLGVPTDKVTYEIITEPKKGFLGIGETLAKVRVIFTAVKDPAEVALEFVKNLVGNMNITAEVTIEDGEDNKIIKISGSDAAVLIGHHGETLDQLQYLVNLVANKKNDGDEAGEKSGDGERQYTKIVIDVEDYRAKREAALRSLARRMAVKVLKYKKNVALEPMSAYERRIIHSEVQKMDGVTTASIGVESNRRVVISFVGNDQD